MEQELILKYYGNIWLKQVCRSQADKPSFLRNVKIQMNWMCHLCWKGDYIVILINQCLWT